MKLIDLLRINDGKPAVKDLTKPGGAPHFAIEPGDATHYEVVLTNADIALGLVGRLDDMTEGVVYNLRGYEQYPLHPDNGRAFGRVSDYSREVLAYLVNLARGVEDARRPASWERNSTDAAEAMDRR